MRIYQGLKEAVKETERELIEMGTIVHPETMQDKNVKDLDEYETKELQGYGYVITSHIGLEKEFKDLGGDLDYSEQELLDRISSQWLNPGKAWKLREKLWSPFIHDGRFSYTYNERYREQIERLIYELQVRPNTRQAVMTMYDRHQDIANLGGKARIPCSLSYQFLRRIRNGKEVLDIIYVMRSCDLYTHFIYDIYLTMKIQEFMANTLGIDYGHFTHFIGSLHAYKKDYEEKGVF